MNLITQADSNTFAVPFFSCPLGSGLSTVAPPALDALLEVAAHWMVEEERFKRQWGDWYRVDGAYAVRRAHLLGARDPENAAHEAMFIAFGQIMLDLQSGKADNSHPGEFEGYRRKRIRYRLIDVLRPEWRAAKREDPLTDV